MVKNPAQSSFDRKCTTPPVQSFETGFLNFDREQIRSFIANRLPTASGFLEPGQYALLDERSAKDHTVVLGIACSSLHDRDPDAMTEDEREQWIMECEEKSDITLDTWREIRVSFDEAEKLCTILTMESDFTQKLYNDEFVAAHTNSEGVTLVKAAQRAFESAWGGGHEDEDDKDKDNDDE